MKRARHQPRVRAPRAAWTSTHSAMAESTLETLSKIMRAGSLSKFSVRVGAVVACAAISGCFDPLIEDPGASTPLTPAPPGVGTGNGTPAPGVSPATPGVTPPAGNPNTPPASTDPVTPGTPPASSTGVTPTPVTPIPVTPPPGTPPPVTPPTPPASNTDAGVLTNESSGDISDIDGGFDSTAFTSGESIAPDSSSAASTDSTSPTSSSSTSSSGP